MNCTFTINTMNVLHPFARSRIVSACQRWKCDYLEITQSNGMFPVSQKYYGIKRLVLYDCVCYLDADCIVSESCPSPFKLLESKDNCIAVVRDTINDAWKANSYDVPINGLRKTLSELQALPGCKKLKCIPLEVAIGNCFNCGFFVCDPKSSVFDEMVIAFQLEMIHIPEEEQMLFNAMVLSGSWLKAIYVDKVWNWLVTPLGHNNLAYIQHFAGIPWESKRREMDKANLEEFNK